MMVDTTAATQQPESIQSTLILVENGKMQRNGNMPFSRLTNPGAAWCP